jgi:lpxtg cell wall surface protein, collagen binding domain protein
MTKNIKLGLKKSKAYGLCGFILSAAMFTMFATPAYAEETTTVSQPVTEQVQPSVTEANTTEAVVTNSTTETTLAEKSTTEVSKEGKVITVKNPDVDLHFTKGETGNGTGKYVNFKVEYKNVKIPDNVAVNEGDEIVFNMPKEVSFRTDFDFDVKNNLNETVGHAQASVEKGTVTTTFNDYFSKHPLNKEIAMIFDAKWTEAVTSGEITHPNFDGTVKEVHVDPEPELDPGKEKFSKWGSQDSSDAQVLNWTLRFNLAKDKLENIILQDRWSANQEYVPNSLELRTVEDVKTWTGDVSAQEYLDSFHVLNNGFDLKIKTLQKLMYINYKTRLKSSVKESIDPINAVWLTANNDNKLADNYRATISLVGGKGKAVGEAEDIPTPTPEPLKPTPETDGEKPKETPKEEKPKNEIPKETPKEEKPKNEIPKETPKVETPKETEKPTPKEETPKETPKEDEKPKEETPKTEDKPKENKPKVEQPKSDTPQKEEPKKDEEPKTENKKQANENTLPNTGTESNSMFTILSVICFMLGIKLKRTEN